MNDAYIVSAVRTAIGRRKGYFSETHPIYLINPILKEVIRRVGVEPVDVEDVILGCVTPVGEQGANIARVAALHAGFPVTVPGTTINRMCGSSQQAVHFAAQAIIAGDMDLVIAGGIEHMTRVQMGLDWPPNGYPDFPYAWVHQGISAEMMADKWDLTRDELDDYGYQSHKRAAAAIDAGYYDREILPLEVAFEGEKMVAKIDGGVRFDVDREAMRGLKPAFKEDGMITAGNSSQISDGAAVVLVASEAAIKRHNLTPRARIVARAVTAEDPVLMLTGPISATHKILKKAGMKLDDIDLIEVNEAFASVVLAWEKELHADMEKVNVNGGAIANGHPLGASGAKLMNTLLHEMERRQVRYGLQAMCIGHGQGTATILERV